MSIYKVFASNLRDQCSKFESIADVCRRANINRQQFNKYLGGQTIPNQHTLKKIADFFNVKEEELFTSKIRKSSQSTDSYPTSSLKTDQNIFSHFREISQYLGLELFQGTTDLKTGVMRPGLYFCYTPLEHFDGFAVRTLIKIVKIDNYYFFTRRTNYRSHQSGSKHVILGKHQGVVLHDKTSFFLVGRNAVYLNEISVMKIIKNNFGEHAVNSGIALVHGLDIEIACRLCLNYIGDNIAVARSALKQLGVVDFAHRSIDAKIQEHIQCHWHDNQIAVSISLNEKAQIIRAIQSQFLAK